jgi:hypothetical protein
LGTKKSALAGRRIAGLSSRQFATNATEARILVLTIAKNRIATMTLWEYMTFSMGF